MASIDVTNELVGQMKSFGDENLPGDFYEKIKDNYLDETQKEIDMETRALNLFV